MLYLASLFLILSTAPVLVSSISCYSCKDVITVNYTVTIDHIPSFSDCQVVDATQCSVSITWNIHNDTTAIVVKSSQTLATTSDPQNMVMATAFMDIGPDKVTPLLAHNGYFSCTNGDKCNDESALKRFLRSLVIKDTLREDLASLIRIVSPFNPQSAGCVSLNNATGYCPPKDLNNCQRCQISVDQLLTPNHDVCATCPQYSINTNVVTHTTTFLLNTRSQFSDHAQINCQSMGCNSIANINRVYQASKITFDFGTFLSSA